MRWRTCEVANDPCGITERLLEVFKLAVNFKRRMPEGSATTLVYRHWRNEYPDVVAPPFFVLGSIEYEQPRSLRPRGFRFKKGNLSVARLGEIALRMPDRLRQHPRCVWILSPKEWKLCFFGKDPLPKLPRKHEPPSNLAQARKQDDNLDYLVVSEGFNGDRTLQRKAALDIIDNLDEITAAELEQLGFRTVAVDHKSGDLVSTEDAETINNWHPALQSWLRANPKPKDCDVKSRTQLNSLYDKEVAMPEALFDMTGQGVHFNPSKQSKEDQLYRALHMTDAGSFLQ